MKVLIVGYGNVGKGVRAAVKAAPDMQLFGIVTRRPREVERELPSENIVSSDYLGKVTTADVAILCGGSKEDLPDQGPKMARMFNTVDSFDTHAKIPSYWRDMNDSASRANKVALISAGWDPGVFSIMRIMFEAFLPQGSSHTFWGPGVSQGHSDAVRRIDGVIDARQYTLPIEEVLEQVRQGLTPSLDPCQMHKRVVYVTAEPEADRQRIKEEIVGMPHYFKGYETEVHFISLEEMEENHSSYPHGGHVLRTGDTGLDGRSAQNVEFSCALQSNPEFTGSILVACARAAVRLQEEGRIGAFTMDEVPPCFFSTSPSHVLREKII